MAGGEGRSCSRNSFVVDGFPDGCGGSGGVQEIAKAGRAEALGGSCGEYDALEMGQADAREGRPRHDDDRDGGLSGMKSGRASCQERVVEVGLIPGVSGTYKK